MDGYLKIAAFNQNIAKPLGGARVQITSSEAPDKVLDELYTDDSGQTLDVRLTAPPIDYSMQPGQPQPYSLYDVRIQADGFEEVSVKGVQILPDEETYQDVALFPRTSGQPSEITIPPSTLYGTYPEKIPEDEVKELPQSTGLAVLPEPVIPEFVIVHTGVPEDASAPNYWVPFRDYIKNSASCEIYATWPIETLRANILAIISLTLNRVYTVMR
ncbi:MAG: carboxypeptidase-like regulatory domain-containing protein [Oscillospiraceae bacterium]|jgi:hypothetical protein|nr:carboxypeptidase-like regulatory domain-containing protein [Oscillospiraceae bacterium]